MPPFRCFISAHPKRTKLNKKKKKHRSPPLCPRPKKAQDHQHHSPHTHSLSPSLFLSFSVSVSCLFSTSTFSLHSGELRDGHLNPSFLERPSVAFSHHPFPVRELDPPRKIRRAGLGIPFIAPHPLPSSSLLLLPFPPRSFSCRIHHESSTGHDMARTDSSESAHHGTRRR